MQAFRRVVDNTTKSLSFGTQVSGLQADQHGLWQFREHQSYLRWSRLFRYLAALPHLTSLSLYSPPFHCLSEAATLPHLNTLSLLGNSPVDQHYIAAAPLSSMKLLDFENLLGPLLGPYHLPNCQQLRMLSAQDSHPCINGFQSLQELDLRDVDFQAGCGLQVLGPPACNSTQQYDAGCASDLSASCHGIDINSASAASSASSTA